MKNDNDKEYITKATLNEAVDAILEGVNKMVVGLQTDMNARFDKVDGRFEGVENRLDKVEAELTHVKDEINCLKADLSDTPSRQEFEALKLQVERNYPSP